MRFFVIIVLIGSCGRIDYHPIPSEEATCGNGLIETGEFCDDENDRTGDGCTECTVDMGWQCSQEPSRCTICATPWDDHVIALYTFDQVGGEGIGHDLIGDQNGVVIGGSLTAIDGPIGCGSALKTSSFAPPFMEIDDSPDWDLTTGSIDFWIYFQENLPVDTSSKGFLSRDAQASLEAGHLTIYRMCGNYIGVRLQGQASSGQSGGRCAETRIPENAWVHVGVNFGGEQPLELSIDGIQHNGADIAGCPMPNGIECTRDTTIGIAGNANPWVLGGQCVGCTDGLADNVNGGLNGAIDHFRISKIRRNF